MQSWMIRRTAKSLLVLGPMFCAAAVWAGEDQPPGTVLSPAERSPAAQKIHEIIDVSVTLEFVETPLGDVFDFLRDFRRGQHGAGPRGPSARGGDAGHAGDDPCGANLA